jgi:hypothetical protein
MVEEAIDKAKELNPDVIILDESNQLVQEAKKLGVNGYQERGSNFIKAFIA